MPMKSARLENKPSNPLLRPLANERGVALLLALAMLAIMTVIGVFALDTSTTEVKISGNYRTSQEAFFAADRAAMFALGEAKFPFTEAPVGVDPKSAEARALNTRLIRDLTGSNKGSTIVAAGSAGTSLKQGTVELIFMGTEVGGGMSAEFPVRYYLVNAVVGGPDGSEARIEVQSKFPAGDGGGGNNVFNLTSQ